MTYTKFKKTKQEAVNAAAWNRFAFWAFNDSQFSEGCARVGARKNRRGKWMLARIPGGGFLDVKGIDSWRTFWKNWEKYEQAIKREDKFIVDGLVYEYNNHECVFGYKSDREAAEANFPKATEEQKKRAWKIYMKQCQERG
ncbi:MAG: hypothetical protein SPL21_12050 [Fibrobacter sp.]|nr:hypothetical protein [Fibrobacter sp.]